jgi:hypothetical protein
MSLKLHQSAYDYAQKVVQNRRCVLDQPSDWTDHRPARNAEDKFIAVHGLAEFGRWHLGRTTRPPKAASVATSFRAATSRMFIVAQCWPAESLARRYKYTDIELAATHLHRLLDAMKANKPFLEKHHVPSV